MVDIILFETEARLIKILEEGEPLGKIIENSDFTQEDINRYKNMKDCFHLEKYADHSGPYVIDQNMFHNISNKIIEKSLETQCEHASLMFLDARDVEKMRIVKRIYLSEEIAKGSKEDVIPPNLNRNKIGSLHSHLGNEKYADEPSSPDFGAQNTKKNFMTGIVRPEKRK
ncbi:MAG: hypothetical protein JSW73_00720 [Candidatus Woesearchaeota archaeon]|nr:MAG: hypothetical protein JSW73_00720 [Candidatus Woesearchaeota archaeon]